MPVAHQHLARLHQRPILHRHDVERGVVVVFPFRPQNLQPLFYGQVRATDQHSVREGSSGRILAAIAEIKPKVPMVIRLVGTNAEEGTRLLADANGITAETLADAARKVVAAAKGG